ncbi:replication-relaxation family protein [Oceanobacillus caeni]
MKNRDLQIIKDLERFRCMSRDDIVDLYFSHLKHPITSANIVLKRLVRDNKIKVSQSFSPFVYIDANSVIKSNSAKIPHFLKIVDVYKQIKKYENPHTFQAEPKFGDKGTVEPDALAVINGVPFFIEVQRNIYSQKTMNDKIKRYEALYYSNEFKRFPFIIMITDTRYNIESDILTIFQVQSIHDFMQNALKLKGQVHYKPKEIKFKIG